ncbi:MAG TPA: FtsQ-type POTRA domain-containing protein [Candidatus Angelobacter sp.]
MVLADLHGPDEPRPLVAAREGVDHSDDISARAIELGDDDEAQFLRTQKRVPVRRGPLGKKTQTRLKETLVISAILVVFSGVTYATYQYGKNSWRFRLDSSENIEISGVHNAERTQLMGVFGEDIGRDVFFVPLNERKQNLEQIPWVESATVMRLLPNRLAIRIQERTPVAFARVGSRAHLIDANGVILGMPANRQTKYSFPVIEGITDTEPLSSRAAAMRIYSRLVRELDSDGAHYSRDLSEVDLSDPEDVKVTAAAVGSVMVHLGNSELLPRYKLYVNHIAEWRQQFQNLQSVDLRYEGQIVVNPDANQQGTVYRESAIAGLRQGTGKIQNPAKPRATSKTGVSHKRK